MAVPGDKVYSSCLPFGETHQKLLATILIVLGLLALLEYAVRLISLVSPGPKMEGVMGFLGCAVGSTKG